MSHVVLVLVVVLEFGLSGVFKSCAKWPLSMPMV
jgi:hypothetical protein